MIYVYASEYNLFGPNYPRGVASDSHCVKYAVQALKQVGVEEKNIVLLRSRDALDFIQEKRPVILFPGGCAESLMGDVQSVSEKVRSYVREGGTVIGICSGAIFLTSELIKEPAQVGKGAASTRKAGIGAHGPLDLACLQSKWPVFRDENGLAKMGHTSVSVEFSSSEQAPMAFADGAKFSLSPEWNGEVVARYVDIQEDNIAAWHTTYGKGKVIGVGFHPELPLPGAFEATALGIQFFKRELQWAGVISLEETLVTSK